MSSVSYQEEAIEEYVASLRETDTAWGDYVVLDADDIHDIALELPQPSKSDTWKAWSEQDVALVDQRLSEEIAAWKTQAQEVMVACRMDGKYQLGDVTLYPSIEFITVSGTPALRATRLQGWPESPHWYITISTPDGENITYRQGEVHSWGEALSLMMHTQDEYDERKKEAHKKWKKRIRLAKSAVWDAERRVDNAVCALEEARTQLAALIKVPPHPDGLDKLRDLSARIQYIDHTREKLVEERDTLLKNMHPEDGFTAAHIAQTAGITRSMYYRILTQNSEESKEEEV